MQSLPGYGYVPHAGDTIKNGVYQDFANYVQTYPTRWGIVRASRVNNVDVGLRKNFQIVERMKLQLRFDVFNAFNHPRFAAPDTDPERFDLRPRDAIATEPGAQRRTRRSLEFLVRMGPVARPPAHPSLTPPRWSNVFPRC